MTTSIDAAVAAPPGFDLIEPVVESPMPVDETRVPRAAWELPALIGLLAATAVLYIWGLGSSGWANAFYSAAVQAGSVSWKAFFFGSSDAANFITVDKPPLSLWPSALSVRVFGLSSWSILVPQALMGVATVGLVFATVRRWFTPGAALIAGAVVALTPVAVLMFRFNNPDALLVLLLTASAYTLTRALESGSSRWMVGTGVLIGSAFLTKSLQAFVVVPGFALVFLFLANASVRQRIKATAAGTLALVLASTWWVAVVELWPAGSRPYIGGSQTNSALELILGYNGLGRLNGNETGSITPGGGGQTGMWGETGWSRLFTGTWGGQASWLIPTALLLATALLVMTWQRSRTDRTRAAVLLWGSWLVVTALVFSYARGIIHEYYAVALAPAIGALVGIGAAWLWARRADLAPRVVMALAMLVTASWSAVLLSRTQSWNSWLGTVVFVVGVLTAAALLVPATAFDDASAHLGAVGRIASGVVIGAALFAGLAGPAAYALNTAATPHSGSLPTAGPAVAGDRMGPGGRGGAGGFGGARGNPGQGLQVPPGGFAPGGQLPGGQVPGGQLPGGRFPGGGMGGAPGGGAGGLLSASEPSAQVVAALQGGASGFTWAAAAIGANNAAGYQLASGQPVMAIGGFNGSDPYPTLEEFQGFVNAGQVHWFISGGGLGGPGNGGGGTGSQISTWVQENFTAQTIDGVTMYDLSAARSGATA
jgi:4-amino-4-deoxy-L-arabinose transferase-like glycosyltransferase